MASIVLTVDGALVVGPLFQLTLTTSAPVDIPAEILLIDSRKLTFVRVCTLADMIYPTAPDLARAIYHRVSTVTKQFSTLSDAEAAKTAYAAAVQNLLDTYQVGTDTFNNSSTVYSLTGV